MHLVGWQGVTITPSARYGTCPIDTLPACVTKPYIQNGKPSCEESMGHFHGGGDEGGRGSEWACMSMQGTCAAQPVLR